MNYNKLKELWKKDEKMNFKGWDFSYLKNRWKEENLPWDYKTILKKYLKNYFKLLDMGTGGGEFLLSLNHPYDKTSATESWEPNVKLCRERLSPLGISIHQVNNNDNLPFKDDFFDMIINKHADYNLTEIKRILKPNGIFVTQQIGGKNNEILSNRLIKNFKSEHSYYNLNYALEEFENNSFDILYKNEFFPYLRFYDVGAVVYFAKIIVWEFPGFSVDNCFDELCKLYEELKSKPYIESCEHRLIIASRNIKE